MKNVLSNAELEKAQDAVERCIQIPPEKLPHGWNFSFDKSLEALTMHPITWPIIKELSDNKPRLNRGSLAVDTHEKGLITPLHCAREGQGWHAATKLEIVAFSVMILSPFFTSPMSILVMVD
ncbi:MAG: hypothetical protein VYE00_16345 [Candidatus Poribacteria bacterium]|nr:hypothetical protein [Candidatus Poribacteria bacterium]